MSATPEAIKAKEAETRERLELLSMLLFEQLLTEEELIEAGSGVLTITFGDVIALVEEEAKNKGYPAPDPTKLEYILKRSLEDYRSQVSEFEESPEEVAERMGLTAWFVTWGTFDEATLDVLRRAGLSHIEWVTMRDSSVCPLCWDNSGIWPIDAAPEMPAHPSCRCWWAIPEERYDSADRHRRALDNVYSNYMKKIGYRQ